MSERTLLRGMLAERQQNRKQLEKQAEGHMLFLRMHLNPHVPIENLPMDQIRIQTIELHQCWEKIKNLGAEIRKIEDDLNG